MGRRGPRPDEAKRSFVLAAIRCGATAAETARSLGISRERVRQLWSNTTGYPVPTLPLNRRDLASVVARRFWLQARADESGCWIWTGATSQTGYPVGGPLDYAHRSAFAYVKGAIPAGMQVDHTCGRPICVNPAHLDLATPSENKRRYWAQKRGGTAA